jgi:stage II sporulation protein D
MAGLGRWRRAAVLVAGAMLGGSGLVVDASAEPLPVDSGQVGAGGVVIHGKGFGHGRGMSQFGAYGAALAGRSSGQILAFYYPGTRPGALLNPPVRVRLTALDGGILLIGPSSARPRIGIRATGADRRIVTLGVGARGRLVPKAGGFAVQRPSGRVWATVARLAAPVSVSGPTGQRIWFGRRKGDCKNSFDVVYAGSARALYYHGRAYYQAVVRMETYLRGVLSSEMPAGWPAQALRAQAVAARSYAGWARNRGYFYDVRDDTGDQCWDGAAAEHPNTTAAIAATRNLISTHGGRPILAQFSSSNGGQTAAGGAVYLPSRFDPYEARARSPYLAWRVTITPQRLAAFDGAGGITRPTSVMVVRRDGRGVWGGRVLAVRIVGRTAAGGSTYVTISGTTFRRAFGMRSNYFGFTAG